MSQPSPKPTEEETPRETCHLCGALIFPNQERCRFCGSVRHVQKRKVDVAGSLGLFLDRLYFHTIVLFTIFAALGLMNYVIPTPLYQGPWVRLFMVLGLLFVSSAMLTMLDVRQAAKSDDQISSANPVRWFGFVLIGWFAAIPMYLQQRDAVTPAERLSRTRITTAGSAIIALLTVIAIGTILYRGHTFRTDQETMRTIIEKKMKMDRTLQNTKQ